MTNSSPGPHDLKNQKKIKSLIMSELEQMGFQVPELGAWIEHQKASRR